MIKIIEKNVDELIPYENNTKLHPQSQIDTIKKSIEQFGFNDPIAIWGEGNLIIEGHGRLIAAKQLGISEVPCIRLDHLSDDERKAYTIAHNATSLNSSFDLEKLNAELASIDYDMAEFGLAEQIKEIEQEFAKEVIEDEVPEVDEKNIITRLGDIWQLGNHRLMCGDSTKEEDVSKLMNGNKADMVFTDPPYGNGDSGKYGRGQLGVRTILNDENLNCFKEFVSIMPTDKIVYFLQWRTLAESLETIKNKQLKINTVGVWDKKNAGLNGAGGISEQWEAIVFAGNIKYKKFGGNVFSIAREQHKREESPHPHQKPLKLLAEIFDFVNNANVILDPFGGSGSTLIACEQLNRICYMMELDPKYCDVIIKRYETLTGQKAVKIEG